MLLEFLNICEINGRPCRCTRSFGICAAPASRMRIPAAEIMGRKLVALGLNLVPFEEMDNGTGGKPDV